MVGDDDVHADAVPLLEPGGHRAQPVLAPRGDDQVEAVRGKHVGERLADAGRGAGDQSGSASSREMQLARFT